MKHRVYELPVHRRKPVPPPTWERLQKVSDEVPEQKETQPSGQQTREVQYGPLSYVTPTSGCDVPGEFSPVSFAFLSVWTSTLIPRPPPPTQEP